MENEVIEGGHEDHSFQDLLLKESKRCDCN